MSVVVRMEMPENCLKCQLHEFGGVCLLKVEHTAEEWLNIDKRRPLNCPIICSIPEGHGRLVDSEAAFAEIVKRSIKGYISNTGVYAALKEAPTIVLAEAGSPSPKPSDPLPIRGVEYVPTEVDAQTGIVTYELRERRKTCLD